MMTVRTTEFTGGVDGSRKTLRDEGLARRILISGSEFSDTIFLLEFSLILRCLNSDCRLYSCRRCLRSVLSNLRR